MMKLSIASFLLWASTSDALLSPNSVSRDTSLAMAFTTHEKSNMFDGPVPIVQERDACGVGVVANAASSHIVLQQGLSALG